jgi:two-component system response regulator FixJ
MKTGPSDCSPTPPDDPQQAIIYVVDDDVSHLRSISRLLRASGFQVVIHDSATEFLSELRPDMIGCVITDLMMPGMDGRQLQDALCNSGNTLPVIFLTGHGDIPTSVQAMRSGAEDFLTKHAPKQDLLAAVKRALERNQSDRARILNLQALRQPFELLTEREREVLRLVVEGMLNKQIAADLGIHERTVKLHRTNLTTKLGVHSVAELTHMVDELRSVGHDL